MFEISISPDPVSAEARTLRYNEHGYEVIVGARVTINRRLEAICYQLDWRARESISLIHGLQDAGEMRLARLVVRNRHHHAST